MRVGVPFQIAASWEKLPITLGAGSSLEAQARLRLAAARCDSPLPLKEATRQPPIMAQMVSQLQEWLQQRAPGLGAQADRLYRAEQKRGGGVGPRGGGLLSGNLFCQPPVAPCCPLPHLWKGAYAPKKRGCMLFDRQPVRCWRAQGKTRWRGTGRVLTAC